MPDLCNICCITLSIVSAFLPIQFGCTKLTASCPYRWKENQENISIYRHRNNMGKNQISFP